MARVVQYFAILFFFHLLLMSSVLFRVTEARPLMVQSPKKPYFVVNDSGPSPGIGHHEYEDREKPSGDDFEVDVVHSGPSPGEGHK
ncbi:hypothetical protein RND71_000332 [Anisodus tanguticus]|uniref:Transmembrane protein n=1 Tax=Anisodus tanguticus TaxID=243964 RepID=A0AAE1SZA0_9SOLA|nr:hypothetical protein RND71_000332 [Anisodus tanguticus]